MCGEWVGINKECTEGRTVMKVLSIKQPWTSLIARGYKTIEMRTWKTNYRGPLAIHASKKPDSLYGKILPNGENVKYGSDCLGAIIAVCTLLDIVKYDTRQKYNDDILKHCCPEAWYEKGIYGWMLTDIKKLDIPVPCKGHLGLWELSQVPEVMNEAINHN